MITSSQLGFNPRTKEATFECGLTYKSNIPYLPQTTLIAGVSSQTGLPILKGNITNPQIKGKIEKFAYITTDLEFEIEITPRIQSPKPTPIPVAVPKYENNSDNSWDYLAGSLLVAGAAIIIIATIVEDILTLGTGVADDIPSFAAASAMFTSGSLLLNQIRGGIPISTESHGLAEEI